MAVDEAVLEVLSNPPQPPPEPAAPLPAVAVPKLLQYLYLACAWVACAGVASGTVARRALGDGSPVVDALIKVSIGALVFPMLLVLVVTLRLLRAMCAAGFRVSLRTVATEVQIHSRKMFGALTWKALRNPAVLVLLMFLFFSMLVGAGALVLWGLLPVKGSQMARIGAALIDTGILGSMALSCFVIIPSFVVKVWRSK